MRRIGGHVSTSGGINNAIKNSLAIGGNCLQIFAGSPRMWTRSLYPQSLAMDFRKSASQHDLRPIFIHALYLTNLASDNPGLVDKSKSALVTDLTNCAAIGGEGVVLHIGSHQGRGWESSRDHVITAIKEVLDTTPPASTLLLENSAGQKGKIGSMSELSDLLSSISSPRLAICLDTAHAYESGYDFNTEAGLAAWIADIEKYVGFDTLALLHLNDSRTPLGSARDMHENIGDGYIGRDGLQRIITHPPLAHLPLILEVPGLDGSGPDAENISRVKSLLK